MIQGPPHFTNAVFIVWIINSLCIKVLWEEVVVNNKVSSWINYNRIEYDLQGFLSKSDCYLYVTFPVNAHILSTSLFGLASPNSR